MNIQQGRPDGHGAGIHAACSGPATTGADGALVDLALDVVGTQVEASGLSLVGGDIENAVGWRFCVTGQIVLAAAPGLSGVAARLRIDPDGASGFQTVLDMPAQPCPAGGPATIRFAHLVRLAEGAKIDLQVASVGAASVPVETDPAATMLVVEAV